MVQKIEDLKWCEKNEALTSQNANLLEQIPFTLPVSFIKLLHISNGGDIDYDFDYFDEDLKKNMSSGINILYNLSLNENYENFMYLYYNPPEFFPKKLLAFGGDAGGNQICFDYRKNPKTNNPPIVYWDHEASEGRDVSFLANNFSEFLLMLKESDDLALLTTLMNSD